MNSSFNMFESFLILIGTLAIIIAIILFVLQHRIYRSWKQYLKTNKKE